MATPHLSFKLSHGVLNTIDPPIPLAYTWAAKYTLSLGPLLDLSQGVPGTPPQEPLRAALAEASASLGSFGYCPGEGEPTLRQAMALEMRAVYGDGTDITPDDMALTAGCNLAFVAAIMTLADAGDEVILPVPWMTLSMLNITTIPLKTRPEDGFTPSVSECKALITPKTRAIVLVTPNNPTGATYSPALISQFSQLARASGIALIMDETYRDFITTAAPPHALFSDPAHTWRTHLIHLFSFSKSYGVPGHRLGLVVAGPAFQKPLRTVLDSLQICPPRPIQRALAPILGALRPGVADTARTLAARHALFAAHLPAGWAIRSSGAYYAFVRHPFAGRASADVCRRIAAELGVVLLPGAYFCDAAGLTAADDRWVRFSVANCDDARIRAACERLALCDEVFGWERGGA